jgi:phosphotransferase system enzyme I (PtsP)
MPARPEPALAHDSPLHRAERMTLLRELLEELNRNAVLSVTLERTVRQLHQLFRAHAVSIWLREEGKMACAATAGEPPAKRRVELGRGPVGLCAATRAPVFAAGESTRLVRPLLSSCDDAMVFRVAVPLLVDGNAEGVVAVECRGTPLSEPDAEVLLALSAGIAGAVRADGIRREKYHESAPKRRAGGGTRRVVLRGKTVVPGQALGPVVALRRLSRHAHVEHGTSRSVRSAFESAKRIVRDLSDRARDLGLMREVGFLPVFGAMLEDTRFRDVVVERVLRGESIHEAMDKLADGALRGTHGDQDAQQRASDIEDLFAALTMLAQDDPRARPPRAAILVGPTLSPYDVLVTARSKPVGVVLTEREGGDRSRALLRLLDRPALLDVAGVTRWVSDGDIALLDATRGYLLLNPTRVEVAALRDAKKEDKADEQV